MSDWNLDSCKSRENNRGVAYWVFLFLKGLSAIIKRADDLDAAQRTLKTPRRRIYAKLKMDADGEASFPVDAGRAFYVAVFYRERPLSLTEDLWTDGGRFSRDRRRWTRNEED